MIKFVQSTQFINKDLTMFHRETQTPALARTSNLNEELGQVGGSLSRCLAECLAARMATCPKEHLKPEPSGLERAGAGGGSLAAWPPG